MTFNSIAYLFFLPFMAICYYILPARYRWALLLIASVVFYLSFIPVFLLIVIFLVTINFFFSKWLENISAKWKNCLFISTIILNILILVFFKYFHTFFPNIEIYLFKLDLSFKPDPINKLILPLGLSYITFTVLGYLIELKRNTITHEKHFGYFALYLMFFPKVTQGPIEKPQNLIPQLHREVSLNFTLIGDGLKMILWGFFKKLVVADRLAIYVNAVYNNSEYHNGTTLLTATIFFAFQIYADFSGYTDIALGSAKLFGYDLMNNFKRPYLATSIKEFWNRWHISFSIWLRDYVYLPFAYFLTNKLKKDMYFNISSQNWVYTLGIMLTFSICGIWHGVGFNYLFWGLLFGLYLTISHLTKDTGKKVRKRLNIQKSSAFYSFYNITFTFILVLLAWIFFRGESFDQSISILVKIITSYGPVFFENPSNMVFSVFGILVILANDMQWEYFGGNWSLLNSKKPFIRIISILVICILILLIGVFDGGQFIYFQY